MRFIQSKAHGFILRHIGNDAGSILSRFVTIHRTAPTGFSLSSLRSRVLAIRSDFFTHYFQSPKDKASFLAHSGNPRMIGSLLVCDDSSQLSSARIQIAPMESRTSNSLVSNSVTSLVLSNTWIICRKASHRFSQTTCLVRTAHDILR